MGHARALLALPALRADRARARGGSEAAFGARGGKPRRGRAEAAASRAAAPRVRPRRRAARGGGVAATGHDGADQAARAGKAPASSSLHYAEPRAARSAAREAQIADAHSVRRRRALTRLCAKPLIIQRFALRGNADACLAAEQADPHRPPVAVVCDRRLDADSRSLWGMQRRFSALLGGFVNIAAGAVFAIGRHARHGARPQASDAARRSRAEAAKIVAHRVAAVAGADDLQGGRALGVFRRVCPDVVIFSAAIAVRDADNQQDLIAWPPQELTPTSYIGHHLTHAHDIARRGAVLDAAPRHARHVGRCSASSAFGFLWLGGARRDRGRAGQAPGVRRACCSTSSTTRSKGIFHGDRSFVAPLALTVFVWVLLMNAMDFLPVDIVALDLRARLPPAQLAPGADRRREHDLRARAVGVGADDLLSIKVKGLGGWIHELFCAPFGSQPAAVAGQFLFNLVEYISKPLSHSLRLFGNMYAGEIIFLLLWLWAATGLVGHDLRRRCSAWAGRSSTS